MNIRESVQKIFGEAADFDVGERPGAPDVELNMGEQAGFGVLVERKNFQLRPHLKEASAWASLRSSHLAVEQVPIIFAKDPEESHVYAFLLAEDLAELIRG